MQYVYFAVNFKIFVLCILYRKLLIILLHTKCKSKCLNLVQKYILYLNDKFTSDFNSLYDIKLVLKFEFQHHHCSFNTVTVCGCVYVCMHSKVKFIGIRKDFNKSIYYKIWQYIFLSRCLLFITAVEKLYNYIYNFVILQVFYH